MPSESGASSKHRPEFCLQGPWLLDRPLSRAMTTGGARLMSLPQQILVFAGEHQLTALVVQGRGHDHEAGRALRPKLRDGELRIERIARVDRLEEFCRRFGEGDQRV